MTLVLRAAAPDPRRSGAHLTQVAAVEQIDRWLAAGRGPIDAPAWSL